MSASQHAANAVLSALKSALDGGFIFAFAGPVPATPDEALNMSTTHTEVGKFSVNGDGTGLTLEAPVAGVMTKPSGDVWQTLIAFEGAESAATELTPTFYRFCTAADNGRGAASAPRLQGTIGGPTSGAKLTFDSNTWTRDGSSTKGIGLYSVSVGQD